MNEDGSTAQPTDGGSDAPIANENELATELSEEQELSLVDRTLGFNGKYDVKEDEAAAGTPKEDEDKGDETPPETTPPAEDDKPPVVTDDEEEEADKPADIPAVDLSDLWIEFEGVTIDDEGNTTPKTFKVGVDDELPEDAHFKNDKQLAEYLESRKEMKDTKAKREQEYADKVAEQEKTQSESAARQAQLDSWDTEIEELVGAGLLDEPKVKPGEDGFADDPAVQTIDSVFKFMASQNEQSAKDGKPIIKTFSLALNLYNKEQSAADAEADKKAKEDEAKRKAEETKRKGGMVGGSSGGSGGSGSGSGGSPVYKAGSAKSIWQVPVDDIA